MVPKMERITPSNANFMEILVPRNTSSRHNNMDLSKDIAYTDIIPVKRKRTKNRGRDSTVEKYKTEETKDTP